MIDSKTLTEAVAARSREDRPSSTDPPENESPGAAGTATGANEHQQNLRNRSTPRQRRAQATVRRFLTVTCGLRTIGEIKQEGYRLNASAAPSKRLLGCFDSRTASVDAISAAHGGEQ